MLYILKYALCFRGSRGCLCKASGAEKVLAKAFEDAEERIVMLTAILGSILSFVYANLILLQASFSLSAHRLARRRHFG